MELEPGDVARPSEATPLSGARPRRTFARVASAAAIGATFGLAALAAYRPTTTALLNSQGYASIDGLSDEDARMVV